MAMKTMFLFLILTVMAVEAQNPIGIVHVNGTLYCTSNAAPSGNGNTPVFAGATVEVACSVDVVVPAPANTTTNSNGVYRVVLIPLRNATVGSIVSSCRLSILTPLSTCNPTLPSAGLVSNLQFVKTVPNLFWHLTYLVASGFTLQVY